MSSIGWRSCVRIWLPEWINNEGPVIDRVVAAVDEARRVQTERDEAKRAAAAVPSLKHPAETPTDLDDTSSESRDLPAALPEEPDLPAAVQQESGTVQSRPRATLPTPTRNRLGRWPRSRRLRQRYGPPMDQQRARCTSKHLARHWAAGTILTTPTRRIFASACRTQSGGHRDRRPHRAEPAGA